MTRPAGSITGIALLAWALAGLLGGEPGTARAAPSPAALESGAAIGNEVAQDRSWSIESFSAEIMVRPDGVVEVTEVIRPRFRGSYNGIYRRIPVEYRTPSGFSYDLRLDVSTVQDGSGNPLRHEVSREGHYRKIKVWVPDAEDGVRTVVLRYRSPNALKYFEDYQELYWNVTGTEWPVPIRNARASIVLPDGATGVRVRAYAGQAGTQEQDFELSTEGGAITVRSTRTLQYGEGLTVAVAWDPGLIPEPGFSRKAGFFLRDNWPLGLPFLALAIMFPIWFRRGRDPETGSIPARYEPPEELSPAGVGVLIDSRPDMRDITATIVDLAVRGYLRIEEEKEDAFFGLVTDRDFHFELRRDRDEWDRLRDHERRLLNAMFEGGKWSVRLSDLEDEFYKDLPDLKDGIMDLLIDHGFFDRRPDKVKRFWIFIAGTVAVATCAGAGLIGWGLGASPLSMVLGGLGTAALVGGFGYLMPVRTSRGTQTLAQLLGFEEFLSRVESDRYRRMITGPEMFEAFLPYAMALGVEKKWAAAFDDLVSEPPDWYAGQHVGSFHPGVLASDLGRLNAAASTAMTSSPRSSGGSGFSGGGGSVGGGVGGGGGGAF